MNANWWQKTGQKMVNKSNNDRPTNAKKSEISTAEVRSSAEARGRQLMAQSGHSHVGK